MKEHGVADRLRQLMAEKSLEAADLASRLHVDVSTVYRWIEGETTPYKKNLKAIADAYGYNAEWLRTGEGPRLVETNEITPQTAIVIRNPETQKIWLSIEILARVRVHNRIDLEGGEDSFGTDTDGRYG